MSLRINFQRPKGQGAMFSIPNVNKMRYKYAAFALDFALAVSSDGKSEEKKIDVKAKLEAAWRFVTDSAAAYQSCNEYFKSLPRGKSLKEVLKEGDITVHCLVPKEKFTFADVPVANAAGRDIGINPNGRRRPRDSWDRLSGTHRGPCPLLSIVRP